MTTMKLTALNPQRVQVRKWRRFALAGALVTAVTAVALTQVVHAESGMGEGMRFGPPPMMFGGPPEAVGRHIDHMLDGLGVSEAQRKQIRGIATAAAADLKAQADAGRGLRERGARLFTAPSIDASAAEALRQQMLTQHDQSSKRVLQAMLDIGQVLTPEQRAKIGARLQERQAVMQDRMQRMERDHGAPHARP